MCSSEHFLPSLKTIFKNKQEANFGGEGSRASGGPQADQPAPAGGARENPHPCPRLHLPAERVAVRPSQPSSSTAKPVIIFALETIQYRMRALC